MLELGAVGFNKNGDDDAVWGLFDAHAGVHSHSFRVGGFGFALQCPTELVAQALWGRI